MQTIILGGGCFWCTESVFLHIKGVSSVVSGYAGGQADTANYEAVCGGDTGHIEVIKVDFDDTVIDLSGILDIFFATHDPTTQDRQGNDIGRQYASVIFYTHDEQVDIIHHKINELKQQGIAVVTEVYSAPTFYPAESYHQNFYANNPTQGYCNFAIPPKLAKLRSNFAQFFKAS
ncbi:peptide-methionine (S)-S-oxide reductase MsrA [Moraxella nasibovis]|uniref:peptide-methionine (S)-S-oxide reductase MsrA n=1 Tax=Moraxella nasibovis TaxID=2904120 RepID=UPI00240F3FEF|nr:peptide-methionine (S)-S-oxide reductase MsrA [Moraxella nasibovis]WFF38173.1 peptide-methionine (S)-S-oxide reductase MsrA [Moraxella nasibovis]